MSLITLGLMTTTAWALEAFDRRSQSRVEILSLVGSESLVVGSQLELALEETQEIITGEVLAIRKIGHDLELEVLDRVANHHLFIEFPADGITEISR